MATDFDSATGDMDPDELQRGLDASMQPTTPVLAGYEIERLIGQGSFGHVWAGRQRSTGQAVAVKFLSRVTPSARESIRREVVRLASMSAYPGVVAILDADLDHVPPFLVSPLMRESLGELQRGMQKSDALVPVEQGVAWFTDILRVLRQIHQKGFLHCDLKPDNILLDQAGHIAVADFGQAMSLEEDDVRLGTYYYMCPQQAQLSEGGGHLHQPCPGWDLYSLGATLYLLLTGQLPRWSENSRTRLSQTVSTRQKLGVYCAALSDTELVPMQTLNRNVDTALAAIVEGCLELSPATRYSDADQVLTDLEKRARPLVPKVNFRPLLLVLLLLVVYSAALMIYSKSKFTLPTFSPTSFRYLRYASSGHHLSVILGIGLQTALIGGLVGALAAYLRPTR